MTNLPPEIIERMRIHRSQSIDEDGPYESGDHDFENDALTIIDAYLAENDPTPLTLDWIAIRVPGSRIEDGVLVNEHHEWTVRVDGEYQANDAVLSFEEHNRAFMAWITSGDRSIWMGTIYTRGEFRTFCRLFRIEVKA